MPRRKQITADDLEARLRQGYHGDLPWLEIPPEPGYYWFRVIPSTVVRGPAHVFDIPEGYRMLSEGRVLTAGLYTDDGEGRWKRCDTFLRQWAGPLGRPGDPRK